MPMRRRLVCFGHRVEGEHVDAFLTNAPVSGRCTRLSERGPYRALVIAEGSEQRPEFISDLINAARGVPDFAGMVTSDRHLSRPFGFGFGFANGVLNLRRRRPRMGQNSAVGRRLDDLGVNRRQRVDSLLVTRHGAQGEPFGLSIEIDQSSCERGKLAVYLCGCDCLHFKNPQSSNGL
ncbi:hypothetical protein NKH75_23930 [Mesorhizobium sp. M0984]|uniref:hypothetical protein n=1 Tax=Mesorhizobium sp. M0984 TaxID=2957041 RepID=UPI00333B643E